MSCAGMEEKGYNKLRCLRRNIRRSVKEVTLMELKRPSEFCGKRGRRIFEQGGGTLYTSQPNVTKEGGMKRYTPLQAKVDSVEEQGSSYHKNIEEFSSLNNMPVVVGSLHSMLTPFVASYKRLNPKKKLVYIMTDGAALPIYLSKNVDTLKKKGLIDNTITIGSAFGGEYECINIYTALITAKEVLNADVVFVSMRSWLARYLE